MPATQDARPVWRHVLKLIQGLICAAAVWAGTALAEPPVTVTVGARTSGAAIPANFVGLSFGMKSLPRARFFNATNAQLITLFQNLGIHHLRLGGTTVEWPAETPIPNESEIDNLFAFAQAAGVRNVICSLRLLESDPARQYSATNAAIAKYIWAHYRPWLDCFAIGNEPDVKRVFDHDLTITNFTTYLEKWRAFADAVTNAVPEAKFAGPDAGSANVYWTTHFADAEKDSGMISAVTEHFYVGGKGRGVEPTQGIDAMLSSDWVEACQNLYDKVAMPVSSDGLPFRFTEANDHYSGGVRDASDTFAGALWALDFLHWWAAHGASGVDFHNTQWVVNDVITPDSDGRLKINPKGYGIKAFDLGGHGAAEAVTMSNPEKLNITAYAVSGAGDLFVTIINKEHGAGARGAAVTIVSDEPARNVEAIFLTAPNGGVSAKIGVTLGGAPITSTGPWLGKWTPLAVGETGQCVVNVAAASAAIVRISKK